MSPENFSTYIDEVAKANIKDLNFEFPYKGIYKEKMITWAGVIEVIKEYEDNFDYCIKILKDCKSASDIQATLMFIYGTLVRYHHLY